MENMKKPDWFELADNDRPAKRGSKSTKSALAVVATLSLTTLAGWGFIGSDEPNANASDTTGITSTADVSASPTTSPSANTSASATTSATSSSTTTITPPSSSTSDEILPPSKNGGEHEGHERHESGERPDHEKKSGHDISGTSYSDDDNDRFGDDD